MENFNKEVQFNGIQVVSTAGNLGSSGVRQISYRVFWSRVGDDDYMKSNSTSRQNSTTLLENIFSNVMDV